MLRYRALRLNPAASRGRHVPRRLKQPPPPALNQTLALDVVSDTLYDRHGVLTRIIVIP